MEYSSIFNFCSVTSANLTKVYRMKEFFSSFFSSANIIEGAEVHSPAASEATPWGIAMDKQSALQG